MDKQDLPHWDKIRKLMACPTGSIRDAWDEAMALIPSFTGISINAGSDALGMLATDTAGAVARLHSTGSAIGSEVVRDFAAALAAYPEAAHMYDAGPDAVRLMVTMENPVAVLMYPGMRAIKETFGDD